MWKKDVVSDDESETECDHWDEDCIIAHVPPVGGSHLFGFHLMPTCERDPSLEPPKKIMKYSPELRHTLTTAAFTNDFYSSWRSNAQLLKDNIELIVDPFRVCVVENFLGDEALISKLIEEFNEIEWNKRSLDLYEFFQSVDLKYIHSKYIKMMYEFLKCDVKDWVQRLTGEELMDISATCSLYGNTDYLLVHDDQQEDRLIAFVFYFTGPRCWIADYGGALQLFSKDEIGQPVVPIKDIMPSNNQFVFFQVTNDSYHQVSEVLSKNDCRMSINGWFHTKEPPTFKMPAYVSPSKGLFSNVSTEPEASNLDLQSWINLDYLDQDTAKYIQEHIEEHSEISLRNYFKKEALLEISQNLESDQMKWSTIGPPNRRLYEVALEQDAPPVLQRFLSLFRSSQIFSLLKQYTDLDLTSVRYELQRWTPGCYSLLTDYNWCSKNELDLIIYLGCSNAAAVIGGRTMYVSIEEEIQQALIMLDPEGNNLNIVYRDTARITKYVSKCSSLKVFYLLICSYSE